MKQRTTPFKFLDAYTASDYSVFFGRTTETEVLHDALNGVKHLLVYGPSGAGKTSLIECGLRNQFSDADWHAITIRRGNNDINATVFRAINESLENKIPLDAEGYPIDVNMDFGQAIEQLFHEHYQPIYLLFDQFEELLLLAGQEEKFDFFTRLNTLIRYRVPARILLIMREEFIGHLSEFEPLCPSIFKHRFRLEKMGRSNVRQVILQILEAPHYQDDFEVENSENLTDSILSKLPDQKKEIELTHVQVFLSELWDRAKRRQGNTPKPILSEALIRPDDKLEKILDLFLKKQLLELAATYEKDIPLELLAAMISERHTKLQVSVQELENALHKQGIASEIDVSQLLEELETRRIIRSLRKGEETHYEISHDLLASAVGQNLTEEMQLREKAEEIYRVYTEKEGFLSQDDLDYLRPFKQYKAYPPELRTQVIDSIAQIRADKKAEIEAAQAQAAREHELREKAEATAKKARLRALVASIIAGLALLLSWTNYSFYQQVKKGETKLQNEVTVSDSLRKKSDTLLTVALDKQLEAEVTLKKLKQQQKATYLAQAREFIEKKQYDDAIKAYQQAMRFAATSEKRSIQENIAQTRQDKRQYDYTTAKERGIKLATVQECKLAIEYLEKALQLQENEQEDLALNAALEKCKNNKQ